MYDPDKDGFGASLKIKNRTFPKQGEQYTVENENLYNNMNGTNIFIGYSNDSPAPVNGDVHSYTFTFTQPQLIKNITI
mgnify:CR=1 FL=1